MAEYRQVQCSFWTDSFVLRLTPEEKYFYLYLLTNPKSSQCGAYEIPLQVMVFETGYNAETVTKLVGKFEEYGKVLFDPATHELMLVNWLRHNWIGSDKVVARVIKDAQRIKSPRLRAELDTVLIGYGYGIDTGSLKKEDKRREDKEKVNGKHTDRACKLPEDFQVSGEMTEFALAMGLTTSVITSETEKFRDYHRSKGTAFKDWKAAWRNWMRNVRDWKPPQAAKSAPKAFPR